MVFRKMEKEDLEQVCKIEKDSFTLPWSYKSFSESLKKEANLYLVAEEKEEILAYCGVWVIAGEGQINNIAVKKEKQSEGIGSALLCFLFKEGKQRQIQQFTLEVRESNKKAIRLYEKMGFEKLGIRPGFYERPKEDAWIMTVITSMKDFEEPI